jgi:hypothetical protein
VVAGVMAGRRYRAGPTRLGRLQGCDASGLRRPVSRHGRAAGKANQWHARARGRGKGVGWARGGGKGDGVGTGPGEKTVGWGQ